MTVDERVFLCRLLEKIEEQKVYCEMMGVRDRSTFQGETVSPQKGIGRYERSKK
ncbi:MAG: hypothetical protein K2O59_03395 [Lachnospiraceae bacterium]|nr:hypothetical protein [Lachnospiraceae bacterium]